MSIREFRLEFREIEDILSGRSSPQSFKMAARSGASPASQQRK